MSAVLTPNQLKWVEALESGEYRQCREKLTNRRGRTSHCCLGVACELALKDGVDLKVEDRDHQRSYDGSTGTLPYKVQEWLGVEAGNPVIGHRHAAILNDGDCLSFKEIAARVREHGLSSHSPY